VINKGCSQSKASQSNKNMLLSKHSSIQSNPQLIINNDDVQCSHGSTTGEIDSDVLFYMQSRGIKLEQAKKMLINSFLFHLINKIENQKTLSLINNQINLWINNVN
jgi:Fe-S cluster assembly protein SufD